MLDQISGPVFALVCEFVGQAATLIALESTCRFTREVVRPDNRLWYVCYATTYYGLQSAAENPVERSSVIPNNDWRRIHIERSLLHAQRHADCKRSMIGCPVMGDFDERMHSLLGASDERHPIAEAIFSGMFFTECDRHDTLSRIESSSPSLIRFMVYPLLRPDNFARFATVPYAPVCFTFSSMEQLDNNSDNHDDKHALSRRVIRGRLAKFMSHMLSFSSSPNSAFVISAWSPRLPYCSPSVITSREAVGVLSSQLNIPSPEHQKQQALQNGKKSGSPTSITIVDQDVLLQFVLVCVGQPTTKQALHFISNLIAHETAVPM